MTSKRNRKIPAYWSGRVPIVVMIKQNLKGGLLSYLAQLKWVGVNADC